MKEEEEEEEGDQLQLRLIVFSGAYVRGRWGMCIIDLNGCLLLLILLLSWVYTHNTTVNSVQYKLVCILYPIRELSSSSSSYSL